LAPVYVNLGQLFERDIRENKGLEKALILNVLFRFKYSFIERN